MGLLGGAGWREESFPVGFAGTPVIISGSFDKTVRVWRLADGTPVGEPFRHDTEVFAVAVAVLPDGPVVFSGSLDRRLRAWWLADGTPAIEPVRVHDGAVWAVAAGRLPGGPVIITGGDDGTVWTGLTEPLRGHRGPVYAVAAADLPDGTPVIISGGSDTTVRVWRLADGTPLNEPMALLQSIRGLAIHGNVIVAAAGTGLIACQPTITPLTSAATPLTSAAMCSDSI